MAITDHFADRLHKACRTKGSPVCVGLDPVFERLPRPLRRDSSREPAETSIALDAIETFSRGVLEAVAPHVPCVKLQSACFERYGSAGVALYERLTAWAGGLGLLVIADAKRGDIGISAAHYAAGNLGDRARGPDALTINAYFGPDGIEPFLKVAKSQGKGLFALVRTSNPGGDAVQALELRDGRCVADAVAQMVHDLGAGPGLLGACGYSVLGAVVGATKEADAARLRQTMPTQVFLLPGWGAQGGSPQAVKACRGPDGAGILVTASRSVIYAHETRAEGEDWETAVRDAAMKLNAQVRALVGET